MKNEAVCPNLYNELVAKKRLELTQRRKGLLPSLHNNNNGSDNDGDHDGEEDGEDGDGEEEKDGEETVRRRMAGAHRSQYLTILMPR